MSDLLKDSLFFGMVISMLGYETGIYMKKKWKLAVFNPLLIAIILVICVLLVTGVDYESYNYGGQYISYLLTPATVCLAVPLYRQMELLKKHASAILLGIFSGVLTSMISVLVMSILFHLNHKQYVTMLPKSITTAIGMGVSEELGGIVTITVAVIVVTGVLGNVIAEAVCKWFHITEPIAKGVAIGTSAHAVGTARALEMGEIEGAMSGLSIAVAGLLTVAAASVFSLFY